MSVFQSLLLGLVQGITEFLPVSSSGHLVVFRDVLGIDGIPLFYDVLLHIATLIVVCFVFRRRIWELIRALYRAASKRVPFGEEEAHRDHMRTAGMIVIATVFTGAVGLSVSRFLPAMPVTGVYALFLVTSAILIIGRIFQRPTGSISLSPVRSAVLGISQGLGTLPGISRSGITISTALVSGADRQRAGEISFLISIPAIVGALLLELAAAETITAAVSAEALAAGFLAALVSGFAALKLLLYLIRGGKLYLFCFYLIPLGLWGLLVR